MFVMVSILFTDSSTLWTALVSISGRYLDYFRMIFLFRFLLPVWGAFQCGKQKNYFLAFLAFFGAASFALTRFFSILAGLKAGVLDAGILISSWVAGL